MREITNDYQITDAYLDQKFTSTLPFPAFIYTRRHYLLGTFILVGAKWEPGLLKTNNGKLALEVTPFFNAIPEQLQTDWNKINQALSAVDTCIGFINVAPKFIFELKTEYLKAIVAGFNSADKLKVVKAIVSQVIIAGAGKVKLEFLMNLLTLVDDKESRFALFKALTTGPKNLLAYLGSANVVKILKSFPEDVALRMSYIEILSKTSLIEDPLLFRALCETTHSVFVPDYFQALINQRGDSDKLIVKHGDYLKQKSGLKFSYSGVAYENIFVEKVTDSEFSIKFYLLAHNHSEKLAELVGNIENYIRLSQLNTGEINAPQIFRDKCLLGQQNELLAYTLVKFPVFLKILFSQAVDVSLGNLKKLFKLSKNPAPLIVAIANHAFDKAKRANFILLAIAAVVENEQYVDVDQFRKTLNETSVGWFTEGITTLAAEFQRAIVEAIQEESFWDTKKVTTTRRAIEICMSHDVSLQIMQVEKLVAIFDHLNLNQECHMTLVLNPAIYRAVQKRYIHNQEHTNHQTTVNAGCTWANLSPAFHVAETIVFKAGTRVTPQRDTVFALMNLYQQQRKSAEKSIVAEGRWSNVVSSQQPQPPQKLQQQLIESPKLTLEQQRLQQELDALKQQLQQQPVVTAAQKQELEGLQSAKVELQQQLEKLQQENNKLKQALQSQPPQPIATPLPSLLPQQFEQLKQENANLKQALATQQQQPAAVLPPPPPPMSAVPPPPPPPPPPLLVVANNNRPGGMGALFAEINKGNVALRKVDSSTLADVSTATSTPASTSTPNFAQMALGVKLKKTDRSVNNPANNPSNGASAPTTPAFGPQNLKKSSTGNALSSSAPPSSTSTPITTDLRSQLRKNSSAMNSSASTPVGVTKQSQAPDALFNQNKFNQNNNNGVVANKTGTSSSVRFTKGNQNGSSN